MNNLELNTELLPLLPSWYREILDYEEICKTEQEELDQLATAIRTVADNLFFQTMDETAVSIWEQLFGIVPSPSTESLEFRRTRVLSRVSTRPPFTLSFLYQKLDELIGVGQWAVTVDYANYTIYIESSAINQNYATEVAFTVGKIKPAHIVYINTPFVSDVMDITEEISLSERVWNYKLGAWGLGVSPFSAERDKGVIKLPTQTSVTETLLDKTADFIDGDVASARLNDSISITDLTKVTVGNELTVSYTVTASQTELITNAKLQSATGETLTDSLVYVPITDSVIMKHKILVKEGVTI